LINCNLDLDGIRYNLHSLTTKESLIQLLIKLNVFKQSAVELKLLDECNFSGYNVRDWMSDVQLKLEILSFSEERKLKTLEQKLDDLLSNDKKIELELDSIQDLIKNS